MKVFIVLAIIFIPFIYIGFNIGRAIPKDSVKPIVDNGLQKLGIIAYCITGVVLILVLLIILLAFKLGI